jgi:hypothetical protein
VLWKRQDNGSWIAFRLSELTRKEQAFHSAHHLLINDSGQIWVQYRHFDQQTILQRLSPVTTGLIEFGPATVFVDEEELAYIPLKFFRAPGHFGTVSVEYWPVPASAFHNTYGLAGWFRTDSHETKIMAWFINDNVFTPSREVELVLTNVVGAELGEQRRVRIVIRDADPELHLVNNDREPSLPQGITVAAGHTNATLVLERRGSPDGTLILTNIHTMAGTASSARFVPLTNASLTWPSGDRSAKRLSVQVLNQPPLGTNESFTVMGDLSLGGLMFGPVTFRVSLVPHGQINFGGVFKGSPRFNPSRTELALELIGAEGADYVIEMLDQGGSWTPLKEVTLTEPIIQVSVPFDRTGGRHTFFRARRK